MEGLGGVSGKDYQLDPNARLGKGPLGSLMGGDFNFVPEALKSKVQGNVGKVRDMLSEMGMDAWAGDDDDDEGMDQYAQEQAGFIEDMLPGGLRLDGKRLGELRDKMPFLENNDNVLKLINQLYDNVQDTETGQRMSNAFDQLQQDRLTVARANLMRRNKGQPEIVDKLKDVIEPDD